MITKITLYCLSLILLVAFLILITPQHIAQGQAGGTFWSRQFGTSSEDVACAVITDSSGNVYVAGSTPGNLFVPSAGNDDIFLVKYDPNGNILWSRQFGTSTNDYAKCLAVDGQDNVYLGGLTGGNLFGSNAGGNDIFIVKYDQNGNRLLASQFGSSSDDNVASIAVDAQGFIYIAGDTEGNLFGTNAGPVIIPGTSIAPGESSDAFIAKYDARINIVWGKQFGGPGIDMANTVAVDVQGNIYVAGSTQGNLFGMNMGGYDAFVAKFSASGNQSWGKQFGGGFTDAGSSMCIDSIGNIYLAGIKGTNASPALAGVDTFLNKYDTSGTLLWTNILNTPFEDSPHRVSLDPQGKIILAGSTRGSLFGPNIGGYDIYLA